MLNNTIMIQQIVTPAVQAAAPVAGRIGRAFLATTAVTITLVGTIGAIGAGIKTGVIACNLTATGFNAAASKAASWCKKTPDEP